MMQNGQKSFSIAKDTQELLKNLKFLKIFMGACQVGLIDCS